MIFLSQFFVLTRPRRQALDAGLARPALQARTLARADQAQRLPAANGARVIQGRAARAAAVPVRTLQFFLVVAGPIIYDTGLSDLNCAKSGRATAECE